MLITKRARGRLLMVLVLAAIQTAVVAVYAGNPGVELCKAAERNNAAKALKMLGRGVVVNTRCWWGRTPLHEAAGHRQGDPLVRLLIASGADVNARDSSGETPLHDVTSLSIARILVEAGAHVNAADDSGSTPLVTAVIREDVALIRYLLDHEADASAARGRAFDVNIAHTREHARRRQIHTMLTEALKSR